MALYGDFIKRLINLIDQTDRWLRISTGSQYSPCWPIPDDPHRALATGQACLPVFLLPLPPAQGLQVSCHLLHLMCRLPDHLLLTGKRGGERVGERWGGEDDYPPVFLLELPIITVIIPCMGVTESTVVGKLEKS